VGGHAHLQAAVDGPAPGAGCAQRGLGDELSPAADGEPGVDPRRNRPGASPEAVAAVRDGWDRLADRTGAVPFLRPGWIEAWWRAFGAGRLEVLREEEAGRVRALLPVRHRHGAVSSPSTWHSPGFGLLREDRAAGLALLDELFARHPAQVSLGFLGALGPGLDELAEAADKAGYRCLQRTLERSPFVTVDGDWEGYERSLDRNMRSDLRRCRRRLEELGRVVLDVEHDTAHLDEALAVEGLGWKRKAGTAIVSAPQTARFYTEVARWAAASGRLRLIFLRVDGRPVAFHLALEDDRTYFPLKGGFDPAFHAQSPGRLLIHATLERAFAVGLRRYEFLGGSDAYKLRWATEAYDRVLFQAFAPDPAGRTRWAAFAYGRPLAKRAVDELRRRRPALAPGPQAPCLTLHTLEKPSQRSVIFPPSETTGGSARALPADSHATNEDARNVTTLGEVAGIDHPYRRRGSAGRRTSNQPRPCDAARRGTIPGADGLYLAELPAPAVPARTDHASARDHRHIVRHPQRH
jgi:CelD/BcsL family acetyltransferase involved in cellulose biosynthesis